MNALIIVDIQNDFIPGGALGIKEGDHIIEGINNITSKFDYCIYTKDWHPKSHQSFINIWPQHCVQYSYGAQFSDKLKICKDSIIIYKGTNCDIDSYSAFYDNDHIQSTPLNSILQSHNVDTVYLCGLATDYCVKFSALDAKRLGYTTYVITDLTRAVNDHPNNYNKSLEEMENANILLINSFNIK